MSKTWTNRNHLPSNQARRTDKTPQKAIERLRLQEAEREIKEAVTHQEVPRVSVRA